MNEAVVVVTGSDAVLVGEAVANAVDALVAHGERDELVDRFEGDDYELAEVVMAARSISMFGHRVVVARNAARFDTRQLQPLLDYLADPNPTSSLVVVWERGLAAGARQTPLPKKLQSAALDAGGRVVSTTPPSRAKDQLVWIEQQLRDAGVRVDRAALGLVVERFGEDVSRVAGLARVLVGVFGDGAAVGVDDVAPYLGDRGGLPPWDLTDAIDRGEIGSAVGVARRMMNGGERHPLQMLATLTAHHERLVRLDGSGVTDERDAASRLGMKGSTFPAKKALAASRSLGTEGVAAASRLLAAADAGLRGASAVPGEAQIEVLVARLSQLRRRQTATGRRPASGRRGR